MFLHGHMTTRVMHWSLRGTQHVSEQSPWNIRMLSNTGWMFQLSFCFVFFWEGGPSSATCRSPFSFVSSSPWPGDYLTLPCRSYKPRIAMEMHRERRRRRCWRRMSTEQVKEPVNEFNCWGENGCQLSFVQAECEGKTAWKKQQSLPVQAEKVIRKEIRQKNEDIQA